MAPPQRGGWSTGRGAGDTTWYRERRRPAPRGGGVSLGKPPLPAGRRMLGRSCGEPGQSAGPSQRAERSGQHCCLRYVLIPRGNRALVARPDKSNHAGGKGARSRAPPALGNTAAARAAQRGVHAVMPLDVLGRTRVTLTEPASTSLAERPG